jgi:hypothetical protein
MVQRIHRIDAPDGTVILDIEEDNCKGWFTGSRFNNSWNGTYSVLRCLNISMLCASPEGRAVSILVWRRQLGTAPIGLVRTILRKRSGWAAEALMIPDNGHFQTAQSTIQAYGLAFRYCGPEAVPRRMLSCRSRKEAEGGGQLRSYGGSATFFCQTGGSAKLACFGGEK